MAMIELTLSLDADTACHSEARAFIDLEPQCGLTSEQEVPLWAAGEHQWRGLFSVDEGQGGDFGYRVGVVAHDDAEWSLSFRDAGSKAELLADCDRLVGSKCWLIGSCSTQLSERTAFQPSALAAGDTRGRRAPRLRLIRGGAR